MDQLNNSRRIGLLTTRLAVPTPRPQAPIIPAWNTFQVSGCNKITTRKADMVRHMAEYHQNTRVSCPYCPGKYQRSINLEPHINKVHKYAASSLKSSRNISTQTVIQGQNEITPIDIGRITSSYRNYLNPTPSANPIMGRQGTSTLSLRNNDVRIVIRSIQKEQKDLLRTCGFKRVGALEKALAKSKQELSLAPKPPTVDQTSTPPTTSGTHSSHSNYPQGDWQRFVNSIINLDASDEESDLDDSTEQLNNILFNDSHVDNDLKLSESDSSIASTTSKDSNKNTPLITNNNITHNLEETTNNLLGIDTTSNSTELSPLIDTQKIEFTQPSNEEEWDNLILNMNM